MTLQPYDEVAAVPTTGVDSWVPILAAVGELAVKISGTDFVPAEMRGKPAAVAAAILAGREMGIGPMTALQHIHVIKGRPGQSAQLMRSFVLAAGHSIKYVETTDSRCVVEGRRKGEEEWGRVVFTADQARKAKIDLGGYPEDKLLARATSRLCRRMFADCIAGMAYSIEELEDGDTTPGGDLIAIEGGAAAPTPKRTAQRKATVTPTPDTTLAPDTTPPTTPPPGVTSVSGAKRKTAPVDWVPAPPLPGEEDEPAEPAETATGPDRPATKLQMAKMGIGFADMGITDRDERLRLTASLLSRDGLTTATDLTVGEASTLIDLIEQCMEVDQPAMALRGLAGIGSLVAEQATLDTEA